MEKRLNRSSRRPWVALLAMAAVVLFIAGVGVFGALLDGYSQLQHPVSLLGGSGVPRARLFNLLALVLPGIAGAWVAIDLRARLGVDASWWSRLGAQLSLLSAMGMVAMGLLPLDPRDLESVASRLHGTAWTAWVVAFVAGAAALATGLRKEQEAKRLAWASGAAAGMLFLAAFVLSDVIGAGVAQRLAFLVWFGWFAYAAKPAALAARPGS